jgi:subtilase family serine protease
MATHSEDVEVNWVLKEEVTKAQMGNWKRDEQEPEPSMNLDLIVGVVENQAIIQQALNEIADPKNPNYGKVLSKKDISDMAMMPGDRVDVLNWIRAMPNQSRIRMKEKESETGSHIVVEAPIAVWEHVLNTKFHYYKEKGKTNERLIRTESYSLPQEVASSIQMIQGTVQFPTQVNSHPGRSSSDSSTLLDSIIINPGVKNLAAGGTRSNVNDKSSSDG